MLLHPLFGTVGLLLAILHWVHLIKEAQDAAAYQNFLITIEMLGGAVLLWFAFPYKTYQDRRKDPQGRGIPMQNISSHLKDTLNPHDVVNDAIHNFSRTYQHYAIQGDLSERDKDGGSASDGSKRSCSPSEEDEGSPRPAHSSANTSINSSSSSSSSNMNPIGSTGKLSFQNLIRKKSSGNGGSSGGGKGMGGNMDGEYERMTLLIDSDEEEIL